ncbi:HD-GYP domain-containing protein [Ideonella sp.]|uniref:HD-GYP domain-containing protein n=1 Tax=Ideonella sp. TaxID=1929293 RepID=UPI0035B0DDD9
MSPPGRPQGGDRSAEPDESAVDILERPLPPTRPVELDDDVGGSVFPGGPSAQMERMLHDLARLYQERNDALAEASRAHYESVLRLSLAAEFKDDDTGEHVVRIGFLAERVATLMGERPGFAKLLRKAAPMHDVGKIGIPDSVLKKPGPLDPEERQVMNRHAEIGARILGNSRVPLFRMAADIAGGHHERYDGRGYPRGIAGHHIPLAARIVAVVDCFDALLMDRVYRAAMAPMPVREMIEAEVGRAFDPRVAGTVLQHFDELLALRQRLILDGLTVAHLIEHVHREPLSREDLWPAQRAHWN